MTIEEDVRVFLEANQDSSYQHFQAKLIPSIPNETILGVRTPLLRKMAKQLAKRDDVDVFLNALPHTTFEENQLHAFIVSNRKEYDKLLAGIRNFLPFVDNWATCDQMSPKRLGEQPQRALEFAKSCMKSRHPYTVRYGIGILLQLFMDDKFQKGHLSVVAAIASEEYYVNMMRAWYFAEALAMQPEVALSFLEQSKLDAWTHNKAIQKAIESRRISPEQKNCLRTMKRR